MAGGPVTIDAAAHDKLMDEWSLAIGRFMVVFSSCEYWTYLYVETFGSKRLREASNDLMLKARAPLAKSLVLDIGLKAGMAARVEKAFSRLSALAKTRNLIAHNGPMLHVYRDASEKLLLQIELRSAKDEDREITIELIEQSTTEARELDQELAILYGAVRLSENHVGK